MPAYTFVATGVVAVGTGALAPGQPAGKAAGHLLLLATCARAATETLNAAPSGWTLLLETSSTTNDSLALYGRIATNDANDNVSHDFWSGSSSADAQIAAFSGDVYTDLATIVAHSAVVGSSGNVADIPNPALTVTTADTLIVGVGKKSKTTTSNSATITSPAGLSNRIGLTWNNGTVVGLVWDYTQQTIATNIGASIWDQSVEESAPYASLIVALRSATGASTLAPSAAVVAVSGRVAALSTERAIAPAVGAVSLAGRLATLARTRTVAPSTSAMALGGRSPAALATDQIGVTTGALRATGLAPALNTERVITPAVGLVSLSGLVPTLAPAELSAQPNSGAIIVQGLVPTLEATSTADASLGRGHVGTGRRWHGRIGKYEGSDTASVAVSAAFPHEAESSYQPLGGLPEFKPLAAFPVGVERAPYRIPPELLAESRARIAKKRRRREEELILLNLL